MIKDDCIFCKIANGEINSKCIYEDEMFKAILDLSPATKGHTLIIPKQHADNLFDLPEEETKQIFVLAKKLGKQIVTALGADGMNVVQNNGEVAGQTVLHFHLHLIPRYKEDQQKIGWNPLSRTEEELLMIQNQING